MEVIDLSMISFGEMVGTKVGLNGFKRKRKERNWSKYNPCRSFTENEGEEEGTFLKGDVGSKRGFFSKIRTFAVIVAEENDSAEGENVIMQEIMEGLSGLFCLESGRQRYLVFKLNCRQWQKNTSR